MTTTSNERKPDLMKIYVAAPYLKADVVREFHQRLREDGFDVTSSWAETPAVMGGLPEDLPSMRQGQREEIAAENDEGVARANAVVALCYKGLGKEMYCECTLARLLGKPVIWVADDISILPLSAFRRGAARVRDMDLAVGVLASLRAQQFVVATGSGWVW